MMLRSSLLLFLLAACCLELASSCGSTPTPGCGVQDARSLQNQIQLGSLQESREAQKAQTPQDLDCDFESRNCIWTSRSQPPFQRAMFNSQSDEVQRIWRCLTGLQLPGGSFIGVGSSTGQPGEASLAAVAPCQDGDATLMFDTWSAAQGGNGPMIEVCTARMSRELDRDCMTYDPKQGRVVHTIRGPIDEMFLIDIVAKNFNQPSFVAVDNIRYSGRFCEGTGSPTPPTQCDIDCTFEEGNACNWKVRGQGSSGQWNVQGGRIGNPAQGIRRDATGNPNGFYAYVGGESGATRPTDKFVLESPELEVGQGATMNFDLFQRQVNSETTIEANNQIVYTNPRLNGQNYWYKNQQVSLPQGKYPVRITASGVKPHAYVGLDNIKFNGQVGCPGATDSQGGPRRNGPDFRRTEQSFRKSSSFVQAPFGFDFQ